MWMDLENNMLSEISQRQILYNITNMWTNRKEYKGMYIQSRDRLMDIENKLVITIGEGSGRDKLQVWD